MVNKARSEGDYDKEKHKERAACSKFQDATKRSLLALSNSLSLNPRAIV